MITAALMLIKESHRIAGKPVNFPKPCVSARLRCKAEVQGAWRAY